MGILPSNFPMSVLGYVGYAVAAIVLIVIKVVFRPSKLDAIPTVGSSSRLGSWWAGFKYASNAMEVLQEGYEKHKLAPFKVAEFYRWIIVISNRAHIAEILRAPDDTLSFEEAVNDRFHHDYIMGPQIRSNPLHLPLIRSTLTRNLGVLYPQIRDEVVTAFDDALDLEDNEWKSVLAFNIVQKVVCRTSNRLFVGLPLCRDPDWIDLNLRYTFDVMRGVAIIRLFPNLLKPMAARYLTSVNRCKERGGKLLGPIIEERQGHMNAHGNGASKPNDCLSWLMEGAEGFESTVEGLTTRILSLNFAAIHTSSHSFTHALFYLAANPQYAQPLRDEVERIVDKEGWSKAALDKMRKVDSFLKECQRLEGNASVSLSRKAMKDFTFSDGTFIPKGTIMVTATRCMHYDEMLYRNAHEFDPFRFALPSEEAIEAAKHRFASTSIDYLPFGHGRHACPGRFFAANELKSMLAHILVTYDVKLADNATRPASLRLVTAVIADPNAKVMFRRRLN